MSPIKCQHYEITDIVQFNPTCCVFRHRCIFLKMDYFLKNWHLDDCGLWSRVLCRTSFQKSAELLSIWKFDTFLVFDNLGIWEFKLNIFRQKKYILPTCQVSNIYCMFLKSCFSSSQFFWWRNSKLWVEKGP